MSRHIHVADEIHLCVDAQVEIMGSSIVKEPFEELWAPEAMNEGYYPAGPGNFG